MAQIDEILMQAAKVNASDLHIGENTVPLVRIYGNLKPLYEMADTAQGNIDFWKIVDSPCASQGVRFSVAEAQSLFPDKESRVIRLFRPIMTEQQRFILKDKGECDFAYALPSGSRFRINLYRSMGALNAAIRIIPDRIPSWQELQIPEVMGRLTELKSGLVLITGVTGSGKSTTMAAILNELSRNRAVHILSLEDPVVFKFES
ncbi:MAG: Flp pilus assembly complex ATPase component TadA, partial [Acidaminococcaceae bacterium]|nr:Flp pilus assembly complex ATPase component TadA [Acidaminococcaceae bacterium]